MTIGEIEERLHRIQGHLHGDDEMQHIEEDQLYQDFVMYVAATRNDELADMARLILTSLNMRFSRWHA
jgi:DNA-binding FrmR family transcriptional regulator